MVAKWCSSAACLDGAATTAGCLADADVMETAEAPNNPRHDEKKRRFNIIAIMSKC
jgi:hypothetical protein